jgi:squalene cyclase
MFDAVDVLLTMQNAGGGYASYELIRGPKFLEWLNPAEVFGMFSYYLDRHFSSTNFGQATLWLNMPIPNARRP